MKKIYLILFVLLVTTKVYGASITITIPDDKVDEVASVMCPENPTASCVKEKLEDIIKNRVSAERELAIQVNADDVIE